MNAQAKQVGVHYTRADVCEYIARNTIIPTLFNRVEKTFPAAFTPDGSIWRLLREDPDRYIFEVVRCAGFLPGETEREYTARCKRYAGLRARLIAGSITSIADFITCNLDICQFAQDVFKRCNEPQLLQAFYAALQRLTILDPNCGSGAFLLTALDILEPLYAACLSKGVIHSPLAVRDHSENHRDFILKSILLNNLYGVDIMPEAVEACKRQLLLRLTGDSQQVQDIEALFALDLHICTGNVLVGVMSIDEACKLAGHTYLPDRLPQGSLPGRPQGRTPTILRDELDRALASRYRVDVEDAIAFKDWRESHRPFHWSIEFRKVMQQGGFDVVIGNPPYVEYARVKGDYRLLLDNYETGACGNLHAYCLERSIALLKDDGRCGMIVPLSGFSTERMKSLQRLVMDRSSSLHLCFLSGDANPSTLFEGVKFRLCIGIAHKREEGRRATQASPPHIRTAPAPTEYHEGWRAGTAYYSTKYVRWYAEERRTLFRSLEYCRSDEAIIEGSLPKIGHEIELALLRKMGGQPALRDFMGDGGCALYYYNCPVNWMRATTFVPTFRNDRDGMGISTQVRQVRFQGEQHRNAALCIINSSLFFWFWLIYADCYHLTEGEIGSFPIDLERFAQQWGDGLTTLSDELMRDYLARSRRRTYVYKATGKVVYDEFYPRLSKPIIDKIDCVLARYYGFSDEELDFVSNYEIKYRMGHKQGLKHAVNCGT